MRSRSAFALSVAAAGLAAGLALLRPGAGAEVAQAACGDSLSDPQAIFSFEPPAEGFIVTGAPPLRVSATWLLDALVPKGSTASLNWGDGSPATPFAARDCGDDTVSWDVQTHTHTFASPGEYTITWSFTSIFGSFNIPVAMVSVRKAEAPASTPTPAPTAEATATPTATPPPAATATPVPPSTPLAAAVTAVASPTPAAQPSPSASPSPSATATATVAATATPTPAVTAVALVATLAPSPPASSPRSGDLPAALWTAPRIDEIATDGGTVATNLALAGVTLWVLFSSVLMNQVLQDNRSEIDAKTARFGRPLRRLLTRTGGAIGGKGPAMTAVVVLGVTGVIYEFLNPGFGANRASLLLFLSAVLGVGITTYVCSGLEATVTRRKHGVAAAVRPYPAAIFVAAASVVVSRLMNLQPGVVYGFVASAAITGTARIEGHKQGAITIFPVLAALGLSIAALALVEPIRANETAAASFLGQLAIGVGLIIFIGGIEGVAFNMIPLSVTDGGKLFAWRRPVWAAVAVVAAFLAWHVLLNRDRQSFDALRQASTLSILVAFIFYSLLSLGLWWYFRRRGRSEVGTGIADSGPSAL